MRRLFLIVMLCVCALSFSWAVPAKRITMTVEQPDGTMLTLTQRGDEHFHYLMTEDGVMVRPHGKAYYYAEIKDGNIVPSKHLAHAYSSRTNDELRIVEALPKMEQFRKIALEHVEMAQRTRATRAAQKVAEVPSIGDVKIPVLLVQYSDVKFSSDDPKAALEGHVNGEDYKAEGGYGSVREYFVDQSGGEFMPQFDVLGPVTLPNSMKYYGGNDDYGNDKNARAMVKEACQKVDVDFSQYDNNGDGYVDIVYIIYAGYGEASNAARLEDAIWPHQWELETPLSLDGVKISKYACNNELNGYQGATLDGIGTFCHEFSHCLGLPDFYPTGDDQSAFGMESWSLMHYGCYNNNGHTPCGYTGYELDFLGWRELKVIDEPTDVMLTALSEGGSAYKIINDANPNEYYVVECHKKNKWDSFAPAEGMLVLHVDYLESAWENNIVNNYSSHQRMTIIPADNKLTKDSQNGDTFPGSEEKTELTSLSTPAAKVFVGEYMGKDITNISMKDGLVSFSFMKGALGVPVLKGPYDVAENGFSVSWDHVPGIKEYEVSLDMLEESPYILEEDFSNIKKGSSDIGSLLDSYTMETGWQGINVYGLDGAIRVGTASSEGAIVTPYLRTDSTCFTVIYTLKKSASSDNDAGMVLCVTDDEWLDANGYPQLHGYFLTIDHDEWVSYFMVMDTIGKHSYLYIDTRDYSGSAITEAKRVDIDDLYVIAGDISEQLMASNAPMKSCYQAGTMRNVPMRVSKDVDVNKVIAKQRAAKAPDSEEPDSVSHKKYRSTTIYSMRTELDSCRFDELDGGLYRCTVRSVRDSVYSRSSNPVEVLLVDSMMPQVQGVPMIAIDKDSVYMIIDDEEVSLHYTLDGTTPTAYSTRYDGPFALHEKATMQIIARKPSHKRSDVYIEKNWFKTSGETYRIYSDITPQVYLSEAVDGNTEEDYVGDCVVPVTVVYDSIEYKVVGVDAATFRNAKSLRSVTLNESLLSVGDSLFHGSESLRAVLWNVDLPILSTMFDENSYNNLLVYVPSGQEFSHPLIDAGRMALVCDGKSNVFELNGNHSFYCPISFTAEKVSYQRAFAQLTGLGQTAGWETISLPFDVQSYIHSVKGEIAPFGVDAECNFWLAELEGDCFKKTTVLRANSPYIIAMPNNTAYGDYSMRGTVTFTASEALIEVTDAITVSTGAGQMFVPSYESIEPQVGIYVLNITEKYEEYNSGSVFVPNKYALKPFSAYVKPTMGSMTAPLYRVVSQKDVEEEVGIHSVSVRDGVVYVSLDEAQTIVVYDMVGRQVRRVACEAGVTEIVGLHKGIYLVESVKVYVE